MHGRGYENFEWQGGYACHSVDYCTTENVIRYVNNQKKHHYGSLDNTTNAQFSLLRRNSNVY